MGISYANMEKFQRQLHYFVNKEVPQNLMRRQIEISMHLLEILTSDPKMGGTPVDTGFAVRNWRMTVDYMIKGTLGTYEKALARKMKHNLAHTAKDRALGKWTPAKGNILSRPIVVHDRSKFEPYRGKNRDEFLKYAFEMGQKYNMTEWKKVGHIIYVYNNVPYLQVLENGHSKQAPKGWVKRAIVSTKAWCQSKGWI